MDKNMINWFEVAVSDFERAKKFYEAIFNFEIQTAEMGGSTMGFFPYEPNSGKVSGAIVAGEMNTPGADGATLYFNGDPDLSDVLGRVEAAGGKVVMPKTQITPEIGYMAFFMDTEGNRLALHSQN